jgi:ankyrin repeat protein
MKQTLKQNLRVMEVGKRFSWLLGIPLAITPGGLRAAGDETAALLISAQKGRSAEVVEALRGGVPVDGADASGVTALMVAAAGGHTDILALLLQAGAEIDRRDRLGRTALDRAEQAGRSEAARLLRRDGARGSGKSIGDTVCVKPWGGSGFCGPVLGIDGNRYRLRVAAVLGCETECDSNPECSGGPPMASRRRGEVVEVPAWCLTQTSVSGGREEGRPE